MVNEWLVLAPIHPTWSRFFRGRRSRPDNRCPPWANRLKRTGRDGFDGRRYRMILHPWAKQVGRGLKVAVAGLAFAVAGLVVAAAVAAQEPEDGVAPSPAAVPAIDGYWPVERPLARPDMGDLETIRFITEDDYPPFNYLDSTGVLVGFNIDIAWGICTALKV